MAKRILRNASLTVNGVDLSDRVRQINLTTNRNAEDATAMGDTSQVSIAGLKSEACDAEMFQDYAAGEVDATLAPLYDAGTEFTVVVIPDAAAAVSATNPSYTFQAYVQDYQPVAGEVGGIQMASVVFMMASAIVRATS
jgi:ABC-type amino acid transport substrate-binding protein